MDRCDNGLSETWLPYQPHAWLTVCDVILFTTAIAAILEVCYVTGVECPKL